MGPEARRIALSVASGGLLIVLDTTVMIVALPAMVSGLGSTLPTMQWVTTGYILGLVATTPLAGWLAGRFGGKRVYLTALLLFVLTSVAAGASWSAGALIAFRVLQGLAGGVINPVGMAIALASTAHRHRGALMSVLGLPVVIGPVLGPPLAGSLVDAASWRWVLWINLPLGLLALLSCQRNLPDDAPAPSRATRPSVDVVGVGQVAAGGALIVAGCAVVGGLGHLSPAAAATTLTGVVLLALFARRGLRHPSPVVRVDLLRRRSIWSGALVLVTFSAAYFGSLTIPPILVQGVRGDPASTAGLLAVPTGIAVGLTLQVATRLVDRVNPRRVVQTGVGISLAAMLCLSWAIHQGASYTILAALGLALGVGSGATIMPTMTAALRGLDGDDLAQGTTLLNLVSQLSTALGTAAVASSVTIATAARLPQLGTGGSRP